MITKETALKIYGCHREILETQKLINDLEKEFKGKKQNTSIDLIKIYRRLNMDIPKGGNGGRLFDVNPVMAIKILKDHLLIKQNELKAANELARNELNQE